MFNSENILAIATLLLGGCNIFQLLWWRSEKKRHQAEADSAALDVQQKDQDMKKDKYEFIMEKLAKYHNDYMEISEQLKTEARRHIDEITEVERKYQGIISNKCEEMFEIKRQLNYFKSIRCYDKDCPNRITKDDTDIENTASCGNAECQECR